MKISQKRIMFSRIAGILSIVASVSALALSLVILQGTWESWTYVVVHGRHVPGYFYYLALGIIGVFSFSFGLVSGFLALRGEGMKLSIFGLSLLIACGAMVLFPVWAFGLSYLLAILFGLPILVPSVLGIVLVMASGAEFN